MSKTVLRKANIPRTAANAAILRPSSEAARASHPRGRQVPASDREEVTMDNNYSRGRWVTGEETASYGRTGPSVHRLPDA
jgi:hypothetical protein